MYINIGNLLSLIWSKVILYFGYKYNKNVIPTGDYCYKADYDKNQSYGKNGQYIYYTIPCKYYKIINKYWNGCKYYGIITDDSVFDDRCKMCDVNCDEEEIIFTERREKINKILDILKK